MEVGLLKDVECGPQAGPGWKGKQEELLQG